MTNPKKPSSNKKPTNKTNEPDKQSYTAVGIVFFVVGMAMLLSEATRVTGMPFVTLGATFFILGQQESPPNRKK